jgi:hypothetical protein
MKDAAPTIIAGIRPTPTPFTIGGILAYVMVFFINGICLSEKMN